MLRKLKSLLKRKPKEPNDVPMQLFHWAQATAAQIDAYADILSKFDKEPELEYVKEMRLNKIKELQEYSQRFMFLISSLRDFGCTLYGWQKSPPRDPAAAQLNEVQAEAPALHPVDEEFLRALESVNTPIPSEPKGE